MIAISTSFGGAPETWLHLQMAYDLAQARRREDTIRVRTVTDVRNSRQPRLL